MIWSSEFFRSVAAGQVAALLPHYESSIIHSGNGTHVTCMLKEANLRLILLGILAVVCSNPSIIHAQADEDATATGQKWLSVVDEQKYQESWEQASSYFRAQVSLEQWVVALKRSREPLGALVSRTRTRLQFSKSLRGAPDGEYAIIHFETSFTATAKTIDKA